MNKLDKTVSYDEYLHIQNHRAKKKWGKRYEFKIKFQLDFENILKDVRSLIGDPATICCMGCKRNAEFEEFKKHMPKSEVFGVDIVEDVKQTGDNCFVYDFNKLPEDWKEKFDLVYSNSLDHSFDVTVTIKEWSRVTKDKGIIMIVFSKASRVDPSDRYSFEMADAKKLFPKEKFETLKLFDYDQDVFVGVFRKL